MESGVKDGSLRRPGELLPFSRDCGLTSVDQGFDSVEAFVWQAINNIGSGVWTARIRLLLN